MRGNKIEKIDLPFTFFMGHYFDRHQSTADKPDRLIYSGLWTMLRSHRDQSCSDLNRMPANLHEAATLTVFKLKLGSTWLSVFPICFDVVQPVLTDEFVHYKNDTCATVDSLASKLHGLQNKRTSVDKTRAIFIYRCFTTLQ